MSSKWKWVYNPFEYVAGWKAFGIGIVILAITTVVGYFGSTVFYALEIKSVPEITLNMAIGLQVMGLAVTVSIMYLAALIFARQTRFQDILGTVTLAKYPLLLMSVLSLALRNGMESIDPGKIIRNEIALSDYVVLAVFGIIAIVMMIWHVALLYNAFRVSTNLKGIKCAILFTIILLISEIITIVLKSLIY